MARAESVNNVVGQTKLVGYGAYKDIDRYISTLTFRIYDKAFSLSAKTTSWLVGEGDWKNGNRYRCSVGNIQYYPNSNLISSIRGTRLIYSQSKVRDIYKANGILTSPRAKEVYYPSRLSSPFSRGYKIRSGLKLGTSEIKKQLDYRYCEGI